MRTKIEKKEEKRKAVTISMNESEWQAIQAAANLLGVSVSAYFRMLHNQKKSA